VGIRLRATSGPERSAAASCVTAAAAINTDLTAEAAATTVLGPAAEHDAAQSAIGLDQLARFLVAAVDGLVLHYAVHQDADQSHHDMANVIVAGVALTGLSGAPVP